MKIFLPLITPVGTFSFGSVFFMLIMMSSGKMFLKIHSYERAGKLLSDNVGKSRDNGCHKRNDFRQIVTRPAEEKKRRTVLLINFFRKFRSRSFVVKRKLELKIKF